MTENCIPRHCRRSRRLVSAKAAPGVSTPPLWHTANTFTNTLHNSWCIQSIQRRNSRRTKLIDYCYTLASVFFTVCWNSIHNIRTKNTAWKIVLQSFLK